MIFNSVGRPVVRSFVVRIYRSSQDKPELLLGEAEEVREKGVRSFRNLEDLWAIVNRPIRKKPREGSKEGMPSERPPGNTARTRKEDL